MTEPDMIVYMERLASETAVAVLSDLPDAKRLVHLALLELALLMTEKEKRWIAQQRMEMHANE